MTSHRFDPGTAIPTAGGREEWNRLLYADAPAESTLTSALPKTPAMPALSRSERRKSAAGSHAHEPELPLATPTSAFAVISFIFGIGVLVTLGFTGPPAVLLGHFAYPETATGERGGHGLTIAGLFFGYAAIACWITAIVFFATVGKDIRLPQIPTIINN